MTTILVTAAGAPGAAALLRGLHENGEREVRIVGVDLSGRAAWRRPKDKAETYALLQQIGVRGPEFRRVTGAAGVEAAAKELGYPDRPVCFKPVFSSGSRGFRVLDPTVDRAHQLLNERPGAVAMR